MRRHARPASRRRTAYYQILLDEGLIAVNAENIANLKQVVNVTQVAIHGGPGGPIRSHRCRVGARAGCSCSSASTKPTALNDRVGLNQLLYRRPASPLNLDGKIELRRLEIRLDKAVDTATHARQEILEAALAEKNSTTALTLAQMEYLPNYRSAASTTTFCNPVTRPETKRAPRRYSFTIGFNMPIFFWIHQREDVFSAQHSLEAARYSMNSVLSQTEATVTQLYQSAQFAYESAQEYSGA